VGADRGGERFRPAQRTVDADLDVAGRLRVLLDAIEAGQIEADLDHTAYLRGATDALALVADPPASDQR
jgi:hypothetical protein